MATFGNLPQEIQLIIFGQLSLADLISAKNVCRRFNILCRREVETKMERLNRLIYRDCFFGSEICQEFRPLSELLVSMLQESEDLDKNNELLDCHIGTILSNYNEFARCQFLFVMKYLNFDATYRQYILENIVRRILEYSYISGDEKVAFFRLFYLAAGKMIQKRRRRIILSEIERYGKRGGKYELICKLAAIVMSGEEYAAFILRFKN